MKTINLNSIFQKCFLGTSVFLLAACGDKPSINHGVFEPIFQQFEAASLAQGRGIKNDGSIPINFADLTNDIGYGTVGVCYNAMNVNNRYISIDKTFWDSRNEVDHTILLWHELGHCLLGRIHTIVTFESTVLDTSMPISIMYPDVISTSYFTAEKQHYINELFHP